MIPFYIFYSMFGFQRTGDSIWAMADQLARGFLIGATAGRTTLTGEGLQHADGHSPLLAATNPAVVHYDPAFAYEVAHIVQDGLRADVRPRRPDHPRRRGRHLLHDRLQRARRPAGRSRRTWTSRALLRGIYHYAASAVGAADAPRVQLLASGVGDAVDRSRRSGCWPRSGASPPTSGRSPRGTSCARDAVEPRSGTSLHPGEEPRVAVRHRPRWTARPARWSRSATTCAPSQIRSRSGCRQTTASLGTDGFGFADTRAAARRYFQVDAESIVVATLQSLARDGLYDGNARRRPSIAIPSVTQPLLPESHKKAPGRRALC